MAKAPRVAVVVTAYRPGRYIDECLAALSHQSYPDLTVVVVDAAGGDEELARSVGLCAPHARILDGAGLGGYAACANAGARAVGDAPFILFLHDDAVLAPGAVASMVEVAYAANAGVVTPKLVAFDDPRSLITVGWDLDPLFNPAPRGEPGELDQGQLDEVVDVDAASGAAMLVRRDLFDALGGFEEALGLIGEDVDLSVRARLAGARVVSAPHARVRHRGVRTERTRRARRRRQSGTRVVEERVGLDDGERIVRRRRASLLMIETLYAGPIVGALLVLFAIERFAEALWRTATGSPRAGLASLRALRLTRAERDAVRRRRRSLPARARRLGALAQRTWVPAERLVAVQTAAIGAPAAHGAPPRRLARWLPRSPRARWILLAAEVVSLLVVRTAALATAPGGTLLGGIGATTLLGRWVHAQAVPSVLGSGIAPLGSALVGLAGLVLGGDVGLAVRVLVVVAALFGPLAVARLARRELDEVRAALVALGWALGPGIALGVARGSLSLIAAYALAPAILGASLAATQGQRLSPRTAQHARRRLGTVAAVSLAVAPELVVVWVLLVAFEALWWATRRDEYRLRRLGRAIGVAFATALGANLPWVLGLLVVHPGTGVVLHGQVGSSAQTIAAHLFGGGYLVGPAPWLVVGLFLLGLGAFLEGDELAQRARARALVGLSLGALGSLAALGALGASPIEPAYLSLVGALFVLLAAPVGAERLQRVLLRRRLGVAHLGAVLVAAVVAVLGIGAAVSAVVAPASPVALPEGSLALAGGFFSRPEPVLWLEVGPGGPIRGAVLANDVTVAVTRGAQPTFLGQFGPPVTRGYARIAPAVIDALAGRTVELGARLRADGIGEVVVLSQGGGGLAQAVALGIERQVDLRQLLGTPTITIEATSEAPVRVPAASTPAWFVVAELVGGAVLVWSVAGALGGARWPRRRSPRAWVPATGELVEALR